jgi:hypothetical protein
MEKVNIKKFIKNPYKFLRPNQDFMVTKNGLDWFKISFEVATQEVATQAKTSFPDEKIVESIPNEVATNNEVATQVATGVATYGCGCLKIEGKTICEKHQRL